MRQKNQKFYGREGQNLQERTISQIFSVLQQEHPVLSLTGAGGKTTLMNTFAHYAKEEGKRVLVTTTTHIRRSGRWEKDLRGVRECWRQGEIAVFGREAPYGKLSMPDEGILREAVREAQVVLIEADGAKERPCKVPSEREPVILKECNGVIGVLGLSALGRPAEEVCFRLEETLDFLEKTPGECLTQEDFCRIACSENGLRKEVGERPYYVVFNQFDLISKEQGIRLLAAMEALGQSQVCLSERTDGDGNAKQLLAIKKKHCYNEAD